MRIEEIAVELRLTDRAADSKIKALADVTIPLGADGVIRISGFAVLQWEAGSPTRVALPARKGQTRYFETVVPMGKVRSLIEQAVMAEYARARGRKFEAAEKVGA